MVVKWGREQIYDLLIIFSTFFMTVPLEMVALTASRISLIIYLMHNVDTCITNIAKYVVMLAKNLHFCAD